MRGGFRLLLAGLVVSLLCAPAMVGTGAADVDTAACARSRSEARPFSPGLERLESNGILRFGGHDINVHGRNADYDYWADDRPTWNARFRSMPWLYAIAAAGLTDLAVEIAVDWHQSIPDPWPDGNSDLLRRTGWTEGVVTSRLDAVVCLFDLSGDARLVPVIEALAAANMNPERYFGLPRRKPHNHGAMANMALIEASRAMSRPEWQRIALDRLWRDFQQVFAECGVHSEQASGYLLHNLGLWERAAAAFGEQGQAGRASRVEEVLVTVRGAIAQLTSPDGLLPMIGDSHEERGFPPPGNANPRLWCPEEGWAAGRDSWGQPATHYTLRFGPALSMHGHDDHGSMTWWTAVGGGAMVFEDPGTPHRDFGAKAVAKASGKGAHSVLEPVGVAFTVKSSGERLSRGGVDQYLVKDQHMASGTSRDRNVQFDMIRAAMVVKDTAHSNRTALWVQHWRLAPGWVPTGSTRGPVARHSNGSFLHVACRVNGGQWLSPAFKKAWRFPTWGSREPAWELTCNAQGHRVVVETVAVVSMSDQPPKLPSSGPIRVEALR